MPFVKVGEHRVRTEDLLYYYKGKSMYCFVYVIGETEKFTEVPITQQSDEDIKVLDRTLDVHNRDK